MRTILFGKGIWNVRRVAGLLSLLVLMPGALLAADTGAAGDQGPATMPDASLAGPPARVPATMPDPWARANADKVVSEVFRDKWAKARTPGEKVEVARKMLQTAAETGDDDLAAKFVLYEKARDAAVEGLDAELAMTAVGQLAQAFRVDAVAMKLATWTKLVDAFPPDGQQV